MPTELWIYLAGIVILSLIIGLLPSSLHTQDKEQRLIMLMISLSLISMWPVLLFVAPIILLALISYSIGVWINKRVNHHLIKRKEHGDQITTLEDHS